MTYTTTPMITCEQCGKLHPPGTAVCDVCGAALAAWPYVAAAPLAEALGLDHLPIHADLLASLPALAATACPYCGRQNRPGALYCLHCGRGLTGPEMGAVLADGPLPYPGPGPIARAPGPGQLTVGTLLRGRYRIQRKVAQGGMGAVYEVSDGDGPGTPLAIKEMAQAVLHPDERTQALRDFMREATMLATLAHPNLPVFHGFFAEGGKHYMIMEFIAGRTLEQVISSTRGFLPEARVLVWAAQLCDVLDYLHAQDPPIIYRDCKPGNVMLLEGSERVKLIDFGIARFHRAGRPSEDAAYGTAGYAPPEQYGTGDTDQRSDIYALAATLHHLLTGHDPGQNPFHWRSARSYNPHVSRQVDMALLRALELKPELRYPSIAAFRQALGISAAMPTETLADLATHAAPTTALPRPARVPSAPKELPVGPAARSAPITVDPLTDIRPAAPAAAGPLPLLQVDEKVVDLGSNGKRARKGQRVSLRNVGGGELKGRVQANAPWIALQVRQVSGDQIDVTVAAGLKGLALDHKSWPVPNLVGLFFASLRQLVRRAPILFVLALIGLGFLLIESPARLAAGRAGILLLLGAGIVQVWLWWVGRHVAWLVPAARQHTGHVLVETNGGTQRLEVRVLARPSLLRLLLGWIFATLLLLTELVALGWLVLGGSLTG